MALGLMFGIQAHASLYTESVMQPNPINDGKIHILLCGTGIPETNMQAVRKPSCLAVVANKQFLLFDAGEGSDQTLAEYGLSNAKINTIFITHLHSDHIAGLGQILNTSWNHGRTMPINVYGPYGINKVMNGFQQVYAYDTLFRSINGNGRLDPTLAAGIAHVITATNEPHVVYQKNGLTVADFLVSHEPVYPAFGYVVQVDGCKIVISGDTKVTPSLQNAAENADVLISEALSDPLYKDELAAAQATGDAVSIAITKEVLDYHADTLQLAELATVAKVKNLVLTHLLPSIPTDAASKAAFAAGMNQYYHNPLYVADDGDSITLDPQTCHFTYTDAPVVTVQKQKF